MKNKKIKITNSTINIEEKIAGEETNIIINSIGFNGEYIIAGYRDLNLMK